LQPATQSKKKQSKRLRVREEPTEAQDQAQEEKNQQPITGGGGQEAARSKSRR
jgi:hypothetical protein